MSWLSPDERDNEPISFWTYIIAALQILHDDVGATVLEALQMPHAHPNEMLLSSPMRWG
jgi:LuxR family maltose regulon positive regulatory protein